MKKLLLVALATIMAMPAMAATIYSSEDGRNKVDIYGNLRAHIGYGFYNGGSQTISETGGFSQTVSGAAQHQFNYGLQGNSRLGVTVKLGAFTGQVEFGANEPTTINSIGNTIGLRQAWASYAIAGHANKYGSLSFGKMDTPTSMGGYISTGWDADNSLLGYGGSISSKRNFQIQYAWNGLQIALIEKNSSDLRDISVRPAVAYSFGGNGLKGKVGVTFALSQKSAKDANNDWAEKGVVAFGVTFGIKKQFNNLFALAFIARVGLNENRYGEADSRWDNGTFGGQAYGTDGFRFGAAFEFALSPVKMLDVNIGLGYQGTMDLGSLTPNTFIGQTIGRDIPGLSTFMLQNAIAVYARLPIKLDQHWHLVPELGVHVNLDMYSASMAGYTQSYNDNKISFYAMLQLVSIF